jgi:hypothetical protein
VTEIDGKVAFRTGNKKYNKLTMGAFLEDRASRKHKCKSKMEIKHLDKRFPIMLDSLIYVIPHLDSPGLGQEKTSQFNENY